jgi:hypothetical protein
MKHRILLTVSLLMLFLGAPALLLADTPVADPGFAFVDVNNNGLYSASSGDIALNAASGTDLTSLTTATGVFDTQQSVGNYHAPRYRASLVIPASVTLTFTVPVTLKAGLNIIVHGTINAPSLTLKAAGYGYHASNPGKSCGNDDEDDSRSTDHFVMSCPPPGYAITPMCHDSYGAGMIDLTTSTINIGDSFSAESGGDILLNGAVISGWNPLSMITLSSGGRIFGNAQTNVASSLYSDGNITIGSSRGIYMSGAFIGNSASATWISLLSQGPVELTSGCGIYGAGGVLVKSTCGSVKLTDSSVSGNPVNISSHGDMDVSGTSLQSNGAVTLQSKGQVIGARYAAQASSGNSGQCRDDHERECEHASVQCSGGGGGSQPGNNGAVIAALTLSADSLNIQANGSADIAGSSISLYTGALNVMSSYGYFNMPGAFITAPAGIIVIARGNIVGDKASIFADHSLSFSTRSGLISMDDSIINPYSSLAADTALSLSSPQNIMCDRAKWNVAASIALSTGDCISAAQATINVLKPGGQIQFTAYGGLIDITGSSISPVPTFSPSDVTVTGP